MHVNDEHPKYKKTDDFYERDGASQYYDVDDYVCNNLACGIVLHDRKDLMAWALKKKHKYLFCAIYREASKVGKPEIIQEVFRFADKKDIHYIMVFCYKKD